VARFFHTCIKLLVMKTYIIAFLMIAGMASCTHFDITARPDPNTSTSGTLGSVKATDGVLPLNEYGTPRPLDTVVNHR
jgi:hypothetical protein